VRAEGDAKAATGRLRAVPLSLEWGVEWLGFAQLPQLRISEAEWKSIRCKPGRARWLRLPREVAI